MPAREIKVKKSVPIGALILRESPWAWNPEQAYRLLEAKRVMIRQGGKEWIASPEEEIEGRFEFALKPEEGSAPFTTWRIVDP